MKLTLCTLTTLALAAVLCPSSHAQTKLPYGADTCGNGYVWRDAIPGDHACVSPQRRGAVAQENALSSARRVPSGGAYGPDTCANGFVWREAFQGDAVCVTPDSRALVAQENSLAPRRFAVPHALPIVMLAYGLDTCKNGYVWRETVPSDRVCVTPDRRDAVALENSQADALRVPGGGAYGPNTCINGYVWREASSSDQVCVLPPSRSLVKRENAAAPNVYVIAHTPLAF